MNALAWIGIGIAIGMLVLLACGAMWACGQRHYLEGDE